MFTIKKNLYIFISLCCNTLLIADSKTTFVPRSITNNSTLELSINNYLYHMNNDENNEHYISIKPFYQRTNASCNLSKFFLKNNQTSLSIREDGQGDINPLWVSGIADIDLLYDSILTMSPIRQATGSIVSYFVNLDNHILHAWFSLHTAVVHARHHLNLQEFNLENEGIINSYESACDIFDHPTWKAGRLSCKNLTHTGLDDIQIKLGYNFINNNNKNFSTYFTSMIPTGEAPTSFRIFEPLVGSKHLGLGCGFNSNITLSDSWSWMLDIKYNYMLKGKERRCFDLNNGDWSRYLAVVRELEPYFTQPGINSFTQNVEVTPGHTGQSWTAFHYQKQSYYFEVGYNLWIRGSEKINLLEKTLNLTENDDPIGIADLQALVPPLAPAKSAHTAQIQQSIAGNNQVESDTVFTPTTINDLNIESACNKKGHSHTVYITCGYQPCSIQNISFNFSGSYEFSSRLGIPNQYSIWGSVSINI